MLLPLYAKWQMLLPTCAKWCNTTWIMCGRCYSHYGWWNCHIVQLLGWCYCLYVLVVDVINHSWGMFWLMLLPSGRCYSHYRAITITYIHNFIKDSGIWCNLLSQTRNNNFNLTWWPNVSFLMVLLVDIIYQIPQKTIGKWL